MKPRYTIYIPSKGRANKLMTAKMFDRDGVQYKVVVEPSQVTAYTEAGYGERLLVLPEDGKGLVYARNWITEYSQSAGEERHWQVDDDIREIYRANRGWKLRCDSGVAFSASEDFADRYENVALLSLNSWFFVPMVSGTSRGKMPPFYLNHRCYTCILFMNSLPNQWRYPNNEDADMSLQVLADGWCTILLNTFLINTMTTMTMGGGQTEAFVTGARLKMVRALERKWPSVVSVGKRFGHPQHFIKHDWRRFDTKLKLKPGIVRSNSPNEYGLKLAVKKQVESPLLARLVDEVNGGQGE